MRPYVILPVGLVSAAFTSTISELRDLPAPEDINVTVTGSGPGCPDNTLAFNASSDGQILTVNFFGFQLSWTGPETEPNDRAKNCGLTFDIQHSEGYQYSVESLTWRGWAKLDDGVELRIYVATYFEGSSSTNQASIAGGGDWAGGQEFMEKEDVDINWLAYSPCGKRSTMDMNARAMLRSDLDNGAGTTDDGGGTPLTLQVNLVWRSCSN